jgi:Tfp pilus assembly protein PilP
VSRRSWPGVLALGLALASSAHGHAQAPAGPAPGAADPAAARPGVPSLDGVKDTVKDAVRDVLKPGAQAPAPAAPGAAPAPPASDPAGRAAALRRKTLKDDDFVDSDEGNRDPFKSFLRLFVERRPLPTRTVPAIFEKFALEELTLIGVVSGDTLPRAMFRDPGGLGQTVRRGDYLSKSAARVTKILSDRVILELSEASVSGEPRTVEKAVLVRPEEEAAK